LWDSHWSIFCFVFVFVFFFVVFSKSLFVICPLSFVIVSTFRGCVFSCPDIVFVRNKVRLCFWQERACLIYIICVCLRIVVSNPYCVVSLLWFSSFCGLSFFDCPFGIIERLFALLGHLSSQSAFVGFVLINLSLCFVLFFAFGSVWQIVVCHLSVIFCHCIYFLSISFFCTKQKSDHVFDMKYPYYFPGFTKFFAVF
jgi:hypothetical protein